MPIGVLRRQAGPGRVVHAEAVRDGLALVDASRADEGRAGVPLALPPVGGPLGAGVVPAHERQDQRRRPSDPAVDDGDVGEGRHLVEAEGAALQHRGHDAARGRALRRHAALDEGISDPKHLGRVLEGEAALAYRDRRLVLRHDGERRLDLRVDGLRLAPGSGSPPQSRRSTAHGGRSIEASSSP